MKHIQTFESFIGEQKNVVDLKRGDTVTLKKDGKKATIINKLGGGAYHTKYLVKDESGAERVVNLNAIITENKLSESHLDFNIQKSIQLSGATFELDEERTEEDDDRRLDQVQVYYANDRRKGSEWIIKVGVTHNGGYLLEIAEDETVIFAHEYPRNQKAHFDQDCMNSLGFAPDFE